MLLLVILKEANPKATSKIGYEFCLVVIIIVVVNGIVSVVVTDEEVKPIVDWVVKLLVEPVVEEVKVVISEFDTAQPKIAKTESNTTTRIFICLIQGLHIVYIYVQCL